ncbi:DNA-binding beta-propeller fold protein YncE [Fontibacillus solani]|uniref:DNA-binding beta-propeller fold protein YncE n=1 Tax=Fontibacillus solani TaxID=1572857 RepID=A0A7W3SYP2_9BACL|nr:NHL repeat-containing protein [Fontibacillus solani]MBA9088676.1 DNA-binding beta-propeller fold protein YncE [Fontibacillus solani]
MDNNNEILFDYCPGKEILHEPRCIFLTECGHVLIADSKNHYILMVNEKKEIVWTYGEKNNPDFTDHRLMYPYVARELQNGNIILAEHQANRITEVTRDKNIVWYYGNSPIDETSSPRKNHLNGPNYAQELPSGEVVMSDSMNGRVVVIDRAGKMVYSFGSSPKTHFILNYPRSVQVLKDQTFLISDSRNDRIVEIDRLGNILFEYGNEGNSPSSRMLKWPRCVLKDEDRNQYLISDGFNQRFIIIDQDKNVLAEIKEIVYESQAIPLWDPHSIEKVQGNQLLITDSGSNIVAIIDRSGSVSWMYNNENYLLDDPHYATLSQHNSIYIVDTNNNRILEVDLQSNRILNVIEYVYNKNNEKIKLNKPKWIDIISDSEMAILDSQNNCLMVVNIRDDKYPEIMHITGSNICNSRWACRQGSSYFISDFWQHDLLKVTFRC